MSGRLEFTSGEDGGFFPRLAKAMCEGARGVVDLSGSDPRRAQASAEGYVVRGLMQACPGVAPTPPEPPAGRRRAKA